MKTVYHTRNSAKEKLYMTELLNDLYRHGFVRGGKSECMLISLARKLRDESRISFPASRLKKVFTIVVGKENW